MTSKTAFSKPSATEIRFVRQFAADRETLWAMWTRAEHLQHWWRPLGFTTPVCQVEFRPGGSWFYCMQDPAGQRFCGKMIYGEINAPHQFTARDMFTDEDGIPSAGMPQADSQFEFKAINGETVVTCSSRYQSQQERDAIVDMDVETGLSQCFDHLDAYLASLAV